MSKFGAETLIASRPAGKEREQGLGKYVQDTRRIYQDEVDMMEIELLGRQRQQRLADDRAAAERSGGAELGRMQDVLQATELKLDVAKKQLYFPSVQGYG